MYKYIGTEEYLENCFWNFSILWCSCRLWLSSKCLTEEFATFLFVPVGKVRKFKNFNSLEKWLIESWCFLNKFFLGALFWCFCILSRLVTFVCPCNWDPYNRWEEDRMICHLQSSLASIISKFTNHPNELVWLCFYVAQLFLTDQHILPPAYFTPTYFIVLVGANHFPSNLNLQLWSIFLNLDEKLLDLFFWH